jgi:hypothetical protein
VLGDRLHHLPICRLEPDVVLEEVRVAEHVGDRGRSLNKLVEYPL